MNFLQNYKEYNIRLLFCFLVIILLGFTAPLASNGIVIILSLLSLSIFSTHNIKQIKSHTPKLLFLIISLLFLWSFISNIWSPEQEYWTSVKTFLIIYLGLFLAINIFNLIDKNKTLLLYSLIIALAIMSIIFLFESISNGMIIKNLIDINNSQVLEKIARGTVVLSILATPISIFIFSKNKKIGLLCYSIFFISVLALPMTAALIGIILGLVFSILTLLFANKFNYTFFVLISTYIISAPFISSEILTISNIRESNIHLNSPHEHRIGIWEYSSKAVIANLPLGLGFDSSRYLGSKNDKIELMRKDESYAPDALPLHPHNAVIQIWLELGIIGIFLLLALFFELIKKVNQINCKYEKAIFMSLFGSVIPPLILNFGIWQAWWLSTILLCAALSLTIKINKLQFTEKEA